MKTTMKITRIETIPVCVPLKKGLTTKTAHGEHVDSPYVIVKVHTDDGIIGLGEATLAPRWSGETQAGCLAAISQLIEPALVGQDPTQINALRQSMDRVLKLNPFTKCAVEIALWDIAGKAVGKPVYQLLGGKLRSEIPVKLVIGAFPPEHVRRLAEQFLTWGVKCLKVKTGITAAEDVARVKLVREIAGPHVPITIDSNCGWSLSTAKSVLAEMERLDVRLAEQPIPPGDPLAMAEVRRSTSIPIMADESVFSLSDAWGLCVNHAVDVLSVYPGKHGGIGGTLEIANLAKAAGVVCSIGSNLELGIGTAAMLHVAAAMPALDAESYPCDLVGPVYHAHDLLTEPLSIGPAVARVTDGPGLGVELNESLITQYRVN